MLISIVLPTFNGARYIRETVDSCLNQTLKDLELIVVVDGSTDDTKKILQDYDDQRLVVIETENRGQAQAMNAGFEVAKGKYWSWTSDDNIYFPNAFEVMARYLDSHPEEAGVRTDCLVIDYKGKTIGYEPFEWQCFLYRAEAAKQMEPHRKEARIIEDLDFFIRLKHHTGAVGRISKPYLKYRVHSNMVSCTKIKERPLMSVKLNYDYIAKGMLETNLKGMFMDRLSQCALHRAHDTMDSLMEFAREKQVPFLKELETRSQYLKTRFGWLVNRFRIAFVSQIGKVKSRVRLLAYLIAGPH